MMKLRDLLQFGITLCNQWLQSWGGAIAFYTCIPIPHTWTLQFSGIARWAPAIGLLIGSSLGLFDMGLTLLGMPILIRSAIVIAAWVGITGGLHLDGAMDTADGLAVLDPQRRLEVMADSRSGAFGVMVAVIILFLKTTALASLPYDRPLTLALAAGWGRWGQLVAIARYPYLKPSGKGAFHKAAIRSTWEALPSFLLLLAASSLSLWFGGQNWWTVALIDALGCAIALLAGTWLNHKLGGHTGDTYGAIVEWTETLFLCGMTALGSGE